MRSEPSKKAVGRAYDDDEDDEEESSSSEEHLVSKAKGM